MLTCEVLNRFVREVDVLCKLHQCQKQHVVMSHAKADDSCLEVHAHLPTRCHWIIRIERRITHQHFIHNGSKRPPEKKKRKQKIVLYSVLVQRHNIYKLLTNHIPIHNPSSTKLQEQYSQEYQQ